MAAERRCDGVRERLQEALLARGEVGRAEREHLAQCAGCAAVQARLRSLAKALDALPVPEPRPELVATTLARARTALAEPSAHRSPSAARSAPVAGFGAELLRVLAAAAAPLPLVLLWNWAVLALGAELLGPFLPAPLLAALAVGWGLAAAGWLALLYGSIPFLAHRRAVRRLNEVTP